MTRNQRAKNHLSTLGRRHIAGGNHEHLMPQSKTKSCKPDSKDCVAAQRSIPQPHVRACCTLHSPPCALCAFSFNTLNSRAEGQLACEKCGERYPSCSQANGTHYCYVQKCAQHVYPSNSRQCTLEPALGARHRLRAYWNGAAPTSS